MAEIRHRVGITAHKQRVFEAISSVEGVRSWWTSEVSGSADEGGRLSFGFGKGTACVMAIEEIDPGKRLVWRCVDGPEEWRDTTVSFELTHQDGETALVFCHGLWGEPSDLLAHCSTKWAVFLLGLKSLLEGGSSVAWPNDGAISRWG
jgi:uncharacterized protein YndB with AHSA1/START domain